MTCNSTTSIEVTLHCSPVGTDPFSLLDEAFDAHFDAEHDSEGRPSCYLVYYDGWLDEQMDYLAKSLERLYEKVAPADVDVDLVYEYYDGGVLEDANGYHLRIVGGEVEAWEETAVSWEPSRLPLPDILSGEVAR